MPGFAAVSGPAPTAFTPGVGPVGLLTFDLAAPAAATGNLAGHPPALFESTAQTLYVRKTGSDNNGGSSLAVVATGTDGVTDGSAAFTAASGSFDASYLNKLINIVGAGRFRIVAVPNATTLTLSAATGVTATGQTWNVGGTVLTIGSLLSNRNEAVREGDTIYVGAGTYRETVTVNLGPHYNAGSVVSVVGDTDGSHTGDAGMVQVTAYTTDDKTVPALAPTVSFRSGVSLFSFSNIFFVGGNPSSNFGQVIHAGGRTVATSQATSALLSFTGCTFQSGGAVANARLISGNVDNGRPLNWTFDRCLFFPAQSMVVLGAASFTQSQGGADVDLNILVENSLVIGGTGCFTLTTSLGGGAANYKIGGMRLKNIIAVSPSVLLAVTSATFHSTTYPCTLTNSVVTSADVGSAVLSAATGTITEDYNIFQAVVARTNVTVGAHSISDFSYVPLFHFGQEQQWGALIRQFGEPLAGSPMLGYGNDTTQTAYDLRNQIRPAGGGNALPGLGAFERSNTFAKETGTVHTGTNAISATGPAYQDFLVPVTASTNYTFSVYVNYDGSYTGTKPQLLILNGGEAGVTDQTVAAGGSAGGGWVQITATLFSPTSNGIVTVRFQSNDTSGVSKTVFDTFAVT